MGIRLFEEDRIRFQDDSSLKQMLDLMNYFNNCQNELQIIHVAGTNGKGTTCNFIYDILKAHGYKVGLYTSPHIKFYNERYIINDEKISNRKLIYYSKKIKFIESISKIKLTKFEFLTAIAFLFFYDEKCDYVVLETGIGGRLDATNIIKKPVASVITNIGYDHVKVLGNNLESIAKEKSGIIKENSKVIAYDLDQSLKNIIIKEAEKKHSKVIFLDFSKIDINRIALDKTIFSYKGFEQIKLNIKGIQAIYNLCLSLDVIMNIDIPLDYEIIMKAISKSTIKYRFEIDEKRKIIVDVSHNEQSIKNLIDNLKIYFRNEEFICIFGVLDDKDYIKMLNILKDYFKRIYLCRPYSDRAIDEEKLNDINIKNLVITSEYADEIIEKIKNSKSEKEWLVICGSFKNLGGQFEL
ncbi:MAG: Mur ligase family protein [Tissierellia bacterium]|nr:Mur ligase family protein [Tissierellia bacterium]